MCVQVVFAMCLCMCGLCNVCMSEISNLWVCVCVGCVMCGCVYVWVW